MGFLRVYGREGEATTRLCMCVRIKRRLIVFGGSVAERQQRFHNDVRAHWLKKK